MRGVEVQGLEEAQAGLKRTAEDLQGSRFLDAMRKAVMIVTYDAKRNAPVDVGKLQASITPEVRSGNPVQGVVGSNVDYAPYMELGTKPHFPPLAALEVWARRHGRTAYQVALSIAAKGTEPRLYLRDALKDNASKIYGLIGRAVGRIVAG